MSNNQEKVKDAVIAITYSCNSRCRMCNIWKREGEKTGLTGSDFKQLPETLLSVNISGGEPFLHPDILGIIRTIQKRCPKASVIISSNGFATELILEKVEKILKFFPDLGVAISLDGVGRVHDEIRGIPEGYAKVLKTIHGLKKLGVKNLKIGFTLGDYNTEELKKVYQLSKDLGLEFSLAVVHSSENYFGKENRLGDKQEMIRALDWLIDQELSAWNVKRWARAYFAFGAKQFLETGKRILPDYSGESNIFVDPFGKIYPCDVSSEVIGQMKPFELKPKKEACQPSWMVCTARQAIKKHWTKVGFWILKNKLSDFSLAGWISGYNRKRKWQKFSKLIGFDSRAKVLDVGFAGKEYSAVDNFLEKHYPFTQNITALGIGDQEEFCEKYPAVRVVGYRGGKMPFVDGEFDICWSNAVLEHVGNEEAQVEFLREIKRVSKRAFITTPNRNFPVEIHTRVPFLHLMLSKKWLDKFFNLIGKNWATGNYMRLLNLADLKKELEKAGIEEYKIIENKLLFFTLDFIIVI